MIRRSFVSSLHWEQRDVSRYKSYSLLFPARQGTIRRKIRFWFSSMYRTRGRANAVAARETRRWWMLMYSIKGIGVIWRNVVRGSRGCCEIRWKHQLPAGCTATKRYGQHIGSSRWIRYNQNSAPCPRWRRRSPLNSNRRDSRPRGSRQKGNTADWWSIFGKLSKSLENDSRSIDRKLIRRDPRWGSKENDGDDIPFLRTRISSRSHGVAFPEKAYAIVDNRKVWLERKII